MQVLNYIAQNQNLWKLQGDLNCLIEWSDKWLLRFNAAKCKAMHCGQTNPRTDCYMNQPDKIQTRSLDNTSVERDLGVYVTNKTLIHWKRYNAVNKACERTAKRVISRAIEAAEFEQHG